MLHKEKGISNLSQLEKALNDGSLLGLFGMGEKKIENIKRGIQLLKQSKGRMNLGECFSCGQADRGNVEAEDRIKKD